jgi:hypothetical protein
VREAHVAESAPKAKGSVANSGSLKRHRESPPGSAIEDNGRWPPGLDHLIPSSVAQFPQHFIVGSHDRSCLAQATTYVGRSGFQQGQHIEAKVISKESGVEIGSIKARPEVVVDAVLLDVGARDTQERAHNGAVGNAYFSESVARAAPTLCRVRVVLLERLQQPVALNRSEREHSSQPSRPCASQEVHQHGFGLVVCIVAHRDPRCADLPDDTRQKPIACAPGRFLKGQLVLPGQGMHIPLLQRERKAPLGGQRCHELCIRVGICPPRAMIEVSHVKS